MGGNSETNTVYPHDLTRNSEVLHCMSLFDELVEM